MMCLSEAYYYYCLRDNSRKCQRVCARDTRQTALQPETPKTTKLQSEEISQITFIKSYTRRFIYKHFNLLIVFYWSLFVYSYFTQMM